MLTKRERQLLQYLQDEFPLAERPFALAARKSGMTEEEVLRVLARLKEHKVIRYLGAVFDPRRLGIASVLCAMDVPERRVSSVARAVSASDAVSHNYLREGRPNLWFTLSASSPSRLKQAVRSIGRRTGISPLCFASLKTFKIDARFALNGPGLPARAGKAKRGRARFDREAVIRINRPFPLTRRPFAAAASSLGIPASRLIRLIASYKDAGLIRRFGLIIGHRQAGFVSNCMVVWRVPRARMDKAVSVFRRTAQITHCYERATAPGWDYNVYTMVHCRSRSECTGLVRRLARAAGISEYKELFTRREFKKTKTDLASIL
ncbi:MAG: hypothetical protein ACM3OC_06340 [Deltaproteobacteria bacterium]